MLYFAYGSNLHWPQMKERCPSARFVTLAILPEHKLDFTLESPPDFRNGGVADILPTRGHQVWGVVYEIEAADIAKLDGFEGYRPKEPESSNYLREKFTVLPSEGGREDLLAQPFKSGSETGESYARREPLEVQIYIVRQKAPATIPPHRDYLKLIIEGARFWGLPPEYIVGLEGIEDNGRH